MDETEGGVSDIDDDVWYMWEHTYRIVNNIPHPKMLSEFDRLRIASVMRKTYSADEGKTDSSLAKLLSNPGKRRAA